MHLCLKDLKNWYNMQFKQAVRNIALILFVFLLGFAPSSAFSIRNMCLNVVQISDTHISDGEDTSYKMLSSSKKLLKDAIDTVNNIPGVDFVMFTGDMVDVPLMENYKEFFTILSDLNRPSLLTFGNHDSAVCPLDSSECSQGLRIEEVLDFVKKCNGNYVFDKTYYAFTPKTDYRIVVLDPVIRNEVTSNGYLDDEQLAFLDSELEQNQDKVVVIFQHHPVLEPFVSADHSIKNADKYLEILHKYKNPILICSGHYHATKIFRDKNLVFVSTPSLVTFPNAFRLIKITNYKDRTFFEFIFYETNLKSIQEQAKLSTIASASFYGTQKDREQSFMVKKPYVKNKKTEKESVKKEKVKKEKKKKIKNKKSKKQEVQEEIQEMPPADISDDAIESMPDENEQYVEENIQRMKEEFNDDLMPGGQEDLMQYGQ